MSRYSRLSRNELYSYGFKEGQPWAEDRRALESAFRALEREIWQPPSYGWSPSPPAHAWYHPASIRGGSFPQYPPYFPVNRSNESKPYSSSSRRPWSRASEHPSRLGGRSASHHRPGEDIPPFMPDPRTEASPDRFFAPPQSSSSISYRSFRSIEDSPEFPEAQYHPASSNHGSSDASRQPAEFPGYMELVRYNHGAEGEELPYSHSRDGLQAPWSVATTRGTSDSARSRSNSSSYSQESHSDDSGMAASSGYVESYDVGSYDNHYPRESDEGYDDADGISYSSSEDGSGYDDFSDEGYYSEDDGGSYDGDDYD